MVNEAKLIDVLASPVRRDILWMIWDRELSAGEIAAAFALSAATISEHLSVLRDANAVSVRKEKNFRYYRANQRAASALHQILPEETGRWTPADDIPETGEASAKIVPAVVAFVEVDVNPSTAFRAFVDPDIYRKWLGVPVTIEHGRFAATMEWGTQLRGTYDILVPEQLIALQWDISDDTVPIPGRAHVGYMRFHAAGAGTRVEVHQIVDTREQAEFMSAAWALALGRFKQGVDGAVGDHAAAPRPRRPKLARSAKGRSGA